jgi:hypothetical protein
MRGMGRQEDCRRVRNRKQSKEERIIKETLVGFAF